MSGATGWAVAHPEIWWIFLVPQARSPQRHSPAHREQSWHLKTAEAASTQHEDTSEDCWTPPRPPPCTRAKASTAPPSAALLGCVAHRRCKGGAPPPWVPVSLVASDLLTVLGLLPPGVWWRWLGVGEATRGPGAGAWVWRRPGYSPHCRTKSLPGSTYKAKSKQADSRTEGIPNFNLLA
jgi:hypothetical protein